MSLVVTGATGQLPAVSSSGLLDAGVRQEIAAVVRDKERGRGLRRAWRSRLRIADYSAPATPHGRLPVRRPECC
ncbi:hypothetical protein [Streptomyces sp. KL116D]|uniref:hypothetical protein n=1 Tax=Streptomyces sp. KL116D TaxID=3045152 RepID=UPI0035583C4C